MLSQEIEEKLANRLAQRITETNTAILEEIGSNIKRLSTMNTREAYQLAQMLKYGGSYEKIARKLAKASGRNVEEIYKMFKEIARYNKDFAKQFYQYRHIDFIPYAKDIALQNQVNALARMTAGTFLNLTDTKVIGYVFKDINGNKVFRDIRQTYIETIDRAILSIGQGKESFYNNMRHTLEELGDSGLVQYRSGRTRRLDSAARMNILDGVRMLNEETSKRFGAEYGADGVEISVHESPAPDHADIQGRQFSSEEYRKLENGEIAEDYKGIKFNGSDKRPIGELNCYHKTFNIVLGVSKPLYTDAELKAINELNELGFEYRGKHYSMYEGTQLQRRLETEIRKQKDTQILAKASGDMELVGQSQDRITKLTHKYNDLCKTSGLKPKKERMSVSGYVRTKVNLKNYYRDKLIGLKYNDLEIGISNHFIQKAEERGLRINDFLDAFKNPLNIGKYKKDLDGMFSVKIIGKNVTFAINPENGNIITWWKTSKKVRDKYV